MTRTRRKRKKDHGFWKSFWKGVMDAIEDFFDNND